MSLLTILEDINLETLNKSHLLRRYQSIDSKAFFVPRDFSGLPQNLEKEEDKHTKSLINNSAFIAPKQDSLTSMFSTPTQIGQLFSRKPQHSFTPHKSYKDTSDSVRPLLSVADFNGDGNVTWKDIKEIVRRIINNNYHPLYDLNANGKLDLHDLFRGIRTLGAKVPLLDQQIAQATQATMPYYGPGGLQKAIADGYLPVTPEARGHGIHYYNFNLANEVGNLKELDIQRPVGLNYDAEGNLKAVFYIRTLKTQQPTPDNPLANLQFDPADDFPPPVSFDTLSEEDWHNHQSMWFSGFGQLNPENINLDEGVPFPEAVVSRLEQTQFQVFPESDKFYTPKFWMLHAWVHSLNSSGVFANTHPDLALYAPEELGAHSSEHHGQSSNPNLATDDSDFIIRTDAKADRINSFGGDDTVVSGMGNDSVWGSYGDDLLLGDHKHNSSQHNSFITPHHGNNDMLYGGAGKDSIYGQYGNDRLFGGTEDDTIVGGMGHDVLRGGMGNDRITGDCSCHSHHRGRDIFVLALTEGTDTIVDFQVGFDSIVLQGGITLGNLSVNEIDNNVTIGFGNETLAILERVNGADFIASDPFIIA